MPPSTCASRCRAVMLTWTGATRSEVFRSARVSGTSPCAPKWFTEKATCRQSPGPQAPPVGVPDLLAAPSTEQLRPSPPRGRRAALRRPRLGIREDHQSGVQAGEKATMFFCGDIDLHGAEHNDGHCIQALPGSQTSFLC